MQKKKRQKRRQSVKSIKLAQNFLVHELGQLPFRIYCELISNSEECYLTKMETKTPLFDVIEYKGMYLFFEDFREIDQLKEGMEISIRRVDISNSEVERRAWQSLINELMASDTIDPLLLNRLKSKMPNHIQDFFFEGAFTVQKFLNSKNIPRHQYDYRLQKTQNLKAHQIPPFPDLIQEARNDTQ